MSTGDDHCRRLVEEYFDALQPTSATSYSRDDRVAVYEIAENPFLEGLPEALKHASPKDRQRALRSIVFLALHSKDGPLRIPNDLVRLFISSPGELRLCGPLYHLVRIILTSDKGRGKDGRSFRDLPRGLRMIYTLSILEAEVYNGGFVQFIENARGEYTTEALEDCRLIGADKKAELLKKALASFAEWEAALRAARERDPTMGRAEWEKVAKTIDEEFWPVYEVLDPAYYALEDDEPIFALAERYIRQHPEECVEQTANLNT
jgi:hypothetical protein